MTENNFQQPQGQAGGGKKNVMVVKQTKNPGTALILTALFGPLGMFYTTIKGGIIMMIINLLLVFPTIGLITVITWPIQMIWVYRATVNYNRKLMEEE